MILIIVIIFILIYFWRNIFITIKAGEAGVLYLRFGGGTIIDRTYGEGLHIVAPWNIMTVYNVRYQTFTDQLEALSRMGLKIKVDLTIRYQPQERYLGILHMTVGPDYLNKIIVPAVEENIRVIISQYEADEIYASKKNLIIKLVEESVHKISQRYVNIDNVMITKVILPEKIMEAIDSKIEHQQLAEAYVFKIAREEDEARRKEIEAEGIKNYNTTIVSDLSEQFLRWKGVGVTADLAKSPNTKIIIVGSGKDGLPIVMDTIK